MTFPVEVQNLLHDHIESYEELDILLLLRRESGRAWSADDIASSLRLSGTMTDRALASLVTSRLVETGGLASGLRYRYAPKSEELEEVVARLARAYADSPIDIIKIMSANAISRMRTEALRAFSDAFVFNKGKRNG